MKQKSALGQFMTPAPVARFMASLFPPTTLQTCRLLDAGAGVGVLSGAFLDRLASAEKLNFQNVEIEAYRG
jgi:adenine-specific DNA-methyltransferase